MPNCKIFLLCDSLWYPGRHFPPERGEHDQVHDLDAAHRDHEAANEEADVEHSEVVLVDVKSANVVSCWLNNEFRFYKKLYAYI